MIHVHVPLLKTARFSDASFLRQRQEIGIFLLFSLLLCGFDLMAQTTNVVIKPVGLSASTNSNGNGNNGNSGDNNGKAKGKNKPKVSERPQVIGSNSSNSDNGKGKPANPGNGNSADPVEVTTLVNKFQSARDQYIAAQKELHLKMKDATEDQRAALREQRKDLLDKWKEDQKQFVEEMKDRARDIKQELQPDLGKVVDGASGEGGNGGRGR